MDLKIVENYELGCPTDFEPIFDREWKGTRDICSDSAGGYKVLEKDGESCDSGVILPGAEARNLTSLNGKSTVCGRRGGSIFLRTQRVDPVTLECPEGWRPCSPETSNSDTICIVESEDDQYECPILDLELIHRDNVTDYISLGYTTLEFDE